jgi:SDR family mycofactocin-dependent oxidoreductase
MGRVQEKVALVTGAGRGQGRSHAVRLAEEGADIIAVDICADVEGIRYSMATPEDLAQTAKLVEDCDRRVITAVADVRDYGRLKAAVDRGVATLGRLDIVAANAGVTSYYPSWKLPEEGWDAVVDTNLKGVWHTCKAAIPHLIDGGRGGAIIITSSTAGLRGIANLAHYSAAKTGLVGLMRTMAGELAPHNIRVNTVHPTAVDTDMVHNKATYDLFIPEPAERNRDGVAGPMQALNMLPIPWVDPRDISNAVLFLASDEGRYITGARLPVDAGSSERLL